MRGLSVHNPKHFLSVFLLFLVLAAGCGNEAADRREVQAEKEAAETEEKEDKTEGEKALRGSKEQKEYVYLEVKSIRDINDRKAVYETYVPKGSEVGGGSAFYSEHGLYYFADVESFGGASHQYDSFEHSAELMLEYWQGADMDYTDINNSGILENGDDRYYILTGRGVDYDGTPFEVRQLYYMDMQDSGACISWRLEMNQEYADKETDFILEEIEECYGICLDAMKTGSRLEPDERDPEAYVVKEGQAALEDADGYRYLGITALSDYYGDAVCPVFLPKSKDTNVRNDHAYSFLHGVQVTVDVEEIFYGNNLMADMKNDFDIKCEYREDNPERIRDLKKSEMMPVPGFEDALYAVLSYEKKGYGGEYFPKTEALCYIRFQDDFYLAVEIFLTGESFDDATDAVVRELERAYGMELAEYAMTGTQGEDAEPEADIVTLAGMIDGGESRGEETLPDTVLWFNATYAPLTYSNGWDWKLVGGLEPTKESARIDKQLLRTSWSVTDRESALEKAEWLKEEGHRKSCQERMDELEKLGLLDLEEEEFGKRFRESAIKDKDYRYEMAYQMHRAGLDAEAMAAWDLCRLNQLYAGYYICGYMTYEEAMDASLENSRILQEMYSSWDEMLEGYMLGFRFWRNESDADEDSAVKERQRICDILLGVTDGPYSLDWNMELEKNW